MAKLPLAWASLILLLGSASCTTPTIPSASPSADPTPSESAVPTPDTDAPRILVQDPGPGGVLTQAGVTVTFTEPVRSVDLASFQLTDAVGSVQRSIVSLDLTGRVATLVPEAPLLFATDYTVMLSGLVQDLAGNPLPSTSWSLRTTDVVSFSAGTYTGYQFGDSTTHLTAIRRATLDTPSAAPATAYRVMDGTGYLLVSDGIWDGYWVHGSQEGVALDDLTAPVPPLPTCDYVDLPVARAGLSQWSTTVLDTVFQLPAKYAPDDLLDTSQAGLNGSHLIRAIVQQDLAAMVSAAATNGAKLAIQSAYRSYTGQVLTFDGWVSEVGYAEALQVSARPGHSEHQLGTAIDFRTVGGVAAWRYADWGTTTEGAWLAANAWKFGWVLSYPKGTSAVSCYRYEPWHYRYVGRTTAAAVHAAGVTLREWFWSQGYGIR